MTRRLQTIAKLRDLRGAHDQIARTQAIKAIVHYAYGQNRDPGETDTELFIELLLAKLENGDL